MKNVCTGIIIAAVLNRVSLNAFDYLQANRNKPTFYAWSRMPLLEEQFLVMMLFKQ